MSFLLSVALGATTEFNAMDDRRRAALAKQAEVDAEIDKQERLKKIDTDAQAAALDTKIQNSTDMLASYYMSNPNALHYVDKNTGDIVSLEYPADYYDQVSGMREADRLNTEMQKYGVTYFLDPVEGKQNQYAIKSREADSPSGLYDSFDKAEDEVKRVNSLRGTGSKYESFTEQHSSGNWIVKTRAKAQDDAKPTDPLDTRTKMPLTAGFFYGRHAGTEDAIKNPDRYGYQGIIDLTPDKTLAIAGSEAEKEVYRRTYTILQRSTGSGKAERANEDMKYLFEHFTPDVVKKAVEIYGTNSQGLDTFLRELKDRAENWKIGTADEQEGGRRIVQPILPAFPELADYLDIDPRIEQMFTTIGVSPTLLRRLNTEAGNPANLPLVPLNPEIDDSPLSTIVVPNLVQAYAQPTGQNEGGRTVTALPSDVTNVVTGIAAKSPSIDEYMVYKLIDRAYTLDANNNRQRSPEHTKKTFEGLKENNTILSRVNFVKMASSGDSLEFQFPTLYSEDEAKLVKNLNNFGEYQDQISALEATLPAVDIEIAKAVTDVKGAKDGKSRYEFITGNNDFEGFTKRFDQAGEVMRIHNEFLEIDAAGQLKVGAPLTLDRLKAGASYLIGYLANVDTVRYAEDDVNKENPLRSSASSSSIVSSLEAALEKALSADEGDQMSALINLNMKMQAYAFASMMDPNGRLSDQDRQQADEAIAASGFTANPQSFLAVSAKLYERAKRTQAVIKGYSSNIPGKIIATHAYVRMGGGMSTSIRKFLGVGAMRTAEDSVEPVGGSSTANTEAMRTMYGRGRTGTTPQVPTAMDMSGVNKKAEQEPTPEAESENRPGKFL